MTRFRERSSTSPAESLSVVVHEVSYYNAVGCPESSHSTRVNSTGTFVHQTTYESIRDVVTPNFHKIIKAGGIINSPLDKVTQIITQSKANFSILYEEPRPGECSKSSAFWWEGPYPSTTWLADGDFLPVSDVSDRVNALKEKAVTGAWANVQQTKVQGYVSLYEMDKTVASFVSLLKRAITIAKDIKTLNVKGLIGQLSPKELADRYMEARYAIRPLLYDMRGFSESNRSLKNRDLGTHRHTFRCFRNDEFSKADTFTKGVGYGDSVIISRVADVSITARAGILSDVLPNYESWPTNLGLHSPLESLWEIIPFGFIWGWFFNIADTLASFSPKVGMRALASWVRSDVVISQNLFVTDYVCTRPNLTIRLDNCSYSKYQHFTTREPDPTRAILPKFDLHFDGLKLLDLAIILKKLVS